MHSGRGGKNSTLKSNHPEGLDEQKENGGNKKTQLDNGSVGLGMSVIPKSTANEENVDTDNVISNPKITELNLEIQQLPFTHPPLPTLLDISFENDIYSDPFFPIREREFVELLVRIIAEATCRKPGGLSSGGLFDAVYRILAEVVSISSFFPFFFFIFYY